MSIKGKNTIGVDSISTLIPEIYNKKTIKVLDSSRYVEKIDGVLVRHINTKSNYLKDLLDLDS